MISVYNVKPKFQQLLKPILAKLHGYGVTANQITVSAIFLSAITGFAFWNADNSHVLFLALPVGLFVRMALNALDSLLRESHRHTKRHEVRSEI